VRGVFPNSDGVILPGMFARLRIPIGKKTNALLVPESAISTDQLGQYVYVVDSENKVVYRHVETGQAVEGLRVVEGKIGPEDHIIVEGLLRARPGVQVVPKMQVAETNPQKSDVAQDGGGQTLDRKK
jgi:multidrug efflux pump subunit AcrA (membrane-fusion protein)